MWKIILQGGKNVRREKKIVIFSKPAQTGPAQQERVKKNDVAIIFNLNFERQIDNKML